MRALRGLAGQILQKRRGILGLCRTYTSSRTRRRVGVSRRSTNTQNTPCEALERAFPRRVFRYGLREGSGGAGYWPGGEGVERGLSSLRAALFL